MLDCICPFQCLTSLGLALAWTSCLDYPLLLEDQTLFQWSWTDSPRWPILWLAKRLMMPPILLVYFSGRFINYIEFHPALCLIRTPSFLPISRGFCGGKLVLTCNTAPASILKRIDKLRWSKGALPLGD